MNIYIIGGGASGMLSSILIKKVRPEYNVILIERNDRVGRKLLVTGNGRCNYTNINMSMDNFHSQNPDFAKNVLANLDNYETIDLFKDLGIYPRIEEDCRVFPLSLQGSSVLDLLRVNMQRLGVVLISHTKIEHMQKNKNGKIDLIGDKTFQADICIVATGGQAMPKSGSDGLGYKLAKDTGHRLIERRPALVQLRSDYQYLKSLSGVRINSWADLLIEGKKVDKRFGDVLFTDYGLSGPVILDLSRRAIQEFKNNKEVQVNINLVNLSDEETYELIVDKMTKLPGLSKEEFISGLTNKRLTQPVFKMVQESYGEDVDFIYKDTSLAKILSHILTNFKLSITGHQDFDHAQTTTGGIDTRDLKDTLESKIIENLYFTGEVIDVDGDCGGYNLQWAWSSAYTVAQDIIN